MRIIAGQFRGRQIDSPRGVVTRPTADRVRESLFSMLASRVTFEDALVLDLFSGSGALGLEALSRGARRVTFVEKNRAACECIRTNARRLEVEREVSVVGRDVDQYLREDGRRDRYDLIFADPPYDTDSRDLPATIARLANAGAMFALEHGDKHSFETVEHHVLTRAFGRTRVSLFDY